MPLGGPEGVQSGFLKTPISSSLVSLTGKSFPVIEIYPNLLIGDMADCTPGTEEMAVVHALKSPCHQRALQYKGALPTIHPNYLSLRQNEDLFLNLIDPKVPLFKKETFKIFLNFANEQMFLDNRTMLIHCNNALSRAPSLAMVLYKHLEGYDDQDYDACRGGFERLYPAYDPGAGIEAFMRSTWEEL